MSSGIRRSINTVHGEDVADFMMRIPLKLLFLNSETSDYYAKMQKGGLKHSEMLLMMAKMVRVIEDHSDGMA